VRRRRSLVIVLVIVAALLLAAILSSGDRTNQATRPTATAQAGPPGRTIVATIPPNPASPRTVQARTGDLVELSVESTQAGTVSLGGYDRVETVDPSSPARFSVSADIVGEHPIELRLDAGSGEARRVGLLLVAR
jgi:hypothetical protein